MTDIDVKYAQLQAAGLDLGAPLAAEEPGPAGGRVKRYEHGNIYWHPSTGAHEVHGGILARYVDMGGPGAYAQTGKREVGYPTADESFGVDGRYRLSRFEWGDIVWLAKGVAIYGAIAEAWRGHAAEQGKLGYPITSNFDQSAGTTAYFEHGNIYVGAPSAGQALISLLEAPVWGRPATLTLDAAGSAPLDSLVYWHMWPGDQIYDTVISKRPGLFSELWAGRLILRSVEARGVDPDEVLLMQTMSRLASEGLVLDMMIAPGQPTPAKDRRLYSLALRLPQGGSFDVAPHAYYSKTSWESFGFAHATDLHVSGRNDGFGGRLEQLGHHKAAASYSNFAENFRDFVDYANYLHDRGALDVVICTGDLVDYVHEAGDVQGQGGNFRRFEDIALGREPGRDPLRLPMFTTFGNHDYRMNPYKLRFILDLPNADSDIGIYGQYRIPQDRQSEQYEPHNLTKPEATELEGNPSLKPGVADKMLDIDVSDQLGSYDYYDQHIAHDTSYTIELGPHRLVMVDSGFDLGVPHADLGWAIHHLVDGTFDESQMIDAGSPNNVGFTRKHLTSISQALTEAGSEGLVIVGVHAPPLNPRANQAPHYLRETEHATAIPGLLKSWDGPGWDTAGKPYFKHGVLDHLLMNGIAEQLADEFLGICAGDATHRPVDLVLCGHAHWRVEFRIERASTGELRYFTDFYTENPQRDYDSMYGADALAEMVEVEVKRGATLPAVAQPPADGKGPRHVVIPPYSRPLNESDDPLGWWREHRPLVVQTSALGYIDHNQRQHRYPDVTFQGWRVAAVAKNVIESIHYVTIEDVRTRGLRLPGEYGGTVSTTDQIVHPHVDDIAHPAVHPQLG
jgi:hypothetical protein